MIKIIWDEVRGVIELQSTNEPCICTSRENYRGRKAKNAHASTPPQAAIIKVYYYEVCSVCCSVFNINQHIKAGPVDGKIMVTIAPSMTAPKLTITISKHSISAIYLSYTAEVD